MSEYRDLSPDEYYTKFAERWLNDRGMEKCVGGERRRVIVGGCCGIFPPHIARIRQEMDGATAAPACSLCAADSSNLLPSDSDSAFVGTSACVCCAPNAA